MFPSGGEAPQKSKKITVNLSLRTNLAMQDQLFYVILFSGKAPDFWEIAGCSFGTDNVYYFYSILGAKPPKILENHDRFVLENKSGNKRTAILCYFVLGKSPPIFRYT